jgi:hypothetical protein
MATHQNPVRSDLIIIIVFAGLVASPALEVPAQSTDSNDSNKAGSEVPSPLSSTNAPPTNPESSSAWSFEIVPYLWLAGYDGTFGLPSSPPSVPPTHSDAAYATHLSGAAMLTAELRYRDVGLFLDGAWVQLTTEGNSASALYSGTEIKSNIAYGTAALSYRLPQVASLQSDLFAGARTWYISTQIEFKPGLAPEFTADNSRVWTDPIIGARLRYDLTRHWFATVLGDFGGFGVGADISWNVFGGMGYRFTSWLSATLGYRYLHVDYNHDGFLMNANIQGFLLGLGFRF